MRRKSNKRRVNRRSRKTAAPTLTLEALRKIVLQEVAGMSGEPEDVKSSDAADAEECDADELADSIENNVDHYKELKLKEMYLKKQHSKLVQEARKVRAQRNRLKKKILRKLK
jgi:hypothetical protein